MGTWLIILTHHVCAHNNSFMIIVYVALLVGGIIFNQTIRSNKLLTLLYLTFLAVVWAGNIEGPDIENYFIQYEESNSVASAAKGYGVTYEWIMSFFSRRDIPFVLYRLIISIIGLVLLFGSLKMWSSNVAILIVAYMATTFFMDGIQMRNFMALPFLYCGFCFLFSNLRYKKTLFALMILLAATIHSSFLGYLLFIVIPTESKYEKGRQRIIVVLSVLLCLLFYFGRSYLSYLNMFVSSVDEDRAFSYNANNTNYGPFIPFFIQLFSVYMLSSFSKCKVIDSCDNKRIHEGSEVLRYCTWINILGLLFVPFSFIQLTFYRLVRNLLLLNVGAYTLVYKCKIKFSIFILAYIALWFYTDYFILGDVESLIMPFFRSFSLIF